MLEIDGEFFEDPCERIMAARNIIGLLLIESALIQYGMIMSQPVFPIKFEKGVIVCQPKSDFIRTKNKSPDHLDIALLAMMEDTWSEQ